MPPNELDRLKDIRDRPRRTHLPEAPKAPESEVPKVELPKRSKRESLRAARETIKHAAESPWAKLIVALVVGGAGGEVHSMLKALDVVTKPELEEEKKRVDEEVKKLGARIDALTVAHAKTREDSVQDHKTLFLTSRYLYFVLPKLGVLVTLPPGAELHKMEFHPAPVPRGPLGPNDAKPIQPAETLPLPPEH